MRATGSQTEAGVACLLLPLPLLPAVLLLVLLLGAGGMILLVVPALFALLLDRRGRRGRRRRRLAGRRDGRGTAADDPVHRAGVAARHVQVATPILAKRIRAVGHRDALRPI